MMQTGDPTGNALFVQAEQSHDISPAGKGKGGDSIWGEEFEDEFPPGLRVRCHDGCLSEALASTKVPYMPCIRLANDDGAEVSLLCGIFMCFNLPSFQHSTRGIVSMANKGANTNKSQFFITYSKAPHLDRKYTIFGRCVCSDA